LNYSVKVFPNPTNEELNVQMDAKKFFPKFAYIINQSGIVVSKLSLRESQDGIYTLNVSSLKSSTYLICLTDERYYSTATKFIIQR
jgi:hypothetical protein